MEDFKCKKFRRKQTRVIKMVQRTFPLVEEVNHDTKHVLVGNAGLTTETSKEDLVVVMSRYGQLENVSMLAKASFSFVTFCDVKVAQKLVQEEIDLNGRRLILLGVNTVPEDIQSTRKELPKGLMILEDFISEREEDDLLSFLDASRGDTKESQLKHRYVKHYGYEFLYGENTVDPNHPLKGGIPEQLQQVMRKIVEKGVMTELPQQITVNEYLPGQGIPKHVDTHSAFEDPILSLSLGSGIMMDFTNPNGSCVSTVLPSRSLLVMSDESRLGWYHGITPRKMDVVNDGSGLTLVPRARRISITFRRLRCAPCSCAFPKTCDTAKNRTPSTISEGVAAQLEKMHVHEVYKEIADHFSCTRYKVWPRISQFIQSLPIGSILLDVGCGNGKNLGHLDGLAYEVGCDVSRELLEICTSRKLQALCADCLRLPFRDSCVDAVICIAVIHHLGTETRRLKAIQEIARVLRQRGQALIYVWAKNQEENTLSSYLKQNKARKKEYKRNKNEEDTEDEKYSSLSDTAFIHVSGEQVVLPVHENRTNFSHQDMLVPWKNKDKDETFHRFYHVFRKDELEGLCRNIECIETVQSYYDEGNWCIQIQKC